MELRSAVEERTSSPLEPDTMVPSQYFDGVGSDAAFQPEKRLMLAVLEEAVATFQRHVTSDSDHSQLLVEEVESWASGADADWPFSFENICNALDIEPEFLRTGMVRWKESQAKASENGTAVYRFPFRRVNGRRHSITGPREYLRKSA